MLAGDMLEKSKNDDSVDPTRNNEGAKYISDSPSKYCSNDFVG
jgi:hypothetical protein